MKNDKPDYGHDEVSEGPGYYEVSYPVTARLRSRESDIEVEDETVGD